jgi:hypothetical protein
MAAMYVGHPQRLRIELIYFYLSRFLARLMTDNIESFILCRKFLDQNKRSPGFYRGQVTEKHSQLNLLKTGNGGEPHLRYQPDLFQEGSECPAQARQAGFRQSW